MQEALTVRQGRRAGPLKVVPRCSRTKPAWACSSVGRAPRLQRGGHGFDPRRVHFVLKKSCMKNKLRLSKLQITSIRNIPSFFGMFEEHNSLFVLSMKGQKPGEKFSLVILIVC